MANQHTEPARFPAVYAPLFSAGLFFAAYQASTLLTGAAGDSPMPDWLPGTLSLAFIVAGVLILLWFVKGVVFSLAERRRSREYPSEPWYWRRDWRSQRLSNNTLAQFGSNLLFLLVALIVAGGSVFFVMTSVEQSGLIELAVVAGAGAIAAFLAWQAIKALRRWRRWGSRYLRLQSFPGFLGTAMNGTLDLPPHLSIEKLSCQLGCYRATRSSGGGGNSRVNEATVWESDEQILTVSADGQEASFRFDPPKGRPVSDWANPDERVKWFVRLTTEADGEFRYEVPVFNQAS